MSTRAATDSGREFPRITPPDPYDTAGVLVWHEMKAGVEYSPPEDGIFLPSWFWRKVFNYITDTQALQNYLKSD